MLGVDVDARMAEFAWRNGVEVEVAAFEAWEAAGRRFDAVVSGQTWHWVDPVAGAGKAAEVLRPDGRLAVFWNTGQPSTGLGEAFAQVYRRVLPASLVARLGPRAVEEAHAAMCTKAAEGIRVSGAFSEPEQWRFQWDQSYTRDEWLDALPTSGDSIPASQMTELLSGIGDAIDAVGGTFTMNFMTFVITAAREQTSNPLRRTSSTPRSTTGERPDKSSVTPPVNADSSGPSGASQGGNDTCGQETYQRGRFSPSTPALRCGLTLEDPIDTLRLSRPKRQGPWSQSAKGRTTRHAALAAQVG